LLRFIFSEKERKGEIIPTVSLRVQ